MAVTLHGPAKPHYGRFTWTSQKLSITPSPDYKTITTDGQHGFESKGADVEISLSAAGRDTVYLRSEVLSENSPYFKAALSDRWSSEETESITMATPSSLVATRKSRMKARFELKYDGDSSMLVRCHPTPHDQRLSQLRERLVQEPRVEYASANWCTTCVRNGLGTDPNSGVHEKCPGHWHPHFRNYVYGTFDHGDEWPIVSDDMPPDEELTVKAHQLGFSLFCGFSLELPNPSSPWGIARVLRLVLKLLEWVDFYSDLTSHASRLVHFILSKEVGSKNILAFPCTYLRLACLLHSEELYRLALLGCASLPYNGGWSPTHNSRRIKMVQQLSICKSLEGNWRLVQKVSELRQWLDWSQDEVVKELMNLGVVEPVPGDETIRMFSIKLWRDSLCEKLAKTRYSPQRESLTVAQVLPSLIDVSAYQAFRFRGLLLMLDDSAERKELWEQHAQQMFATAKIYIYGMFVGGADDLTDAGCYDHLVRDTAAFFSLDCARSRHRYDYPFAVKTAQPPSTLQLLEDTNQMGEYEQAFDRRKLEVGKQPFSHVRMMDEDITWFRTRFTTAKERQFVSELSDKHRELWLLMKRTFDKCSCSDGIH